MQNESVGQIANDVLIDCLQSYMEFVDIMESTLNRYAQLPDKIKILAKTLIEKRRNDWQPILKNALRHKN